MVGAKQRKFCGAVARALLIGVKFGELNEVRIGSGSKMGKLQLLEHCLSWRLYGIMPSDYAEKSNEMEDKYA